MEITHFTFTFVMIQINLSISISSIVSLVETVVNSVWIDFSDAIDLFPQTEEVHSADHAEHDEHDYELYDGTIHPDVGVAHVLQVEDEHDQQAQQELTHVDQTALLLQAHASDHSVLHRLDEVEHHEQTDPQPHRVEVCNAQLVSSEQQHHQVLHAPQQTQNQ
eukprot:CAMPEP_0116890666 /NCGR_PEP_ID=MMETSP0467-20121206/1189_1 /TAXON_ID=283647 /ORGANISM="Mesodinium pulex, Strain SPMC105" /LENGTH=162 /DNA_ID=CAMNT_0004558623 /DNA_START=404 /DNA_END=892 /DNA_ORIENTATION=-